MKSIVSHTDDAFNGPLGQEWDAASGRLLRTIELGAMVRWISCGMLQLSTYSSQLLPLPSAQL
jgi:hypothetical protein